MSITLGIKGFRKWLESKPEDEEIGRCAVPGSCPIAEYLKYQGGEVSSLVLYNIYIVAHDTRRTPAWASRFIKDVDDTGYPGDPITAAEALKVLDNVEGTSGS